MAKKEINIKLILDTANAAKSLKEVKSSIDELNSALSNMDEGTDGFAEMSDKVEELEDNLDSLGKSSKKSLGSVTTGIKGVGVALKSIGIALIIVAFEALKRVLKEQQPILDLVETTFNAIGLVIGEVTRIIGDAFSANSEMNGGFDASITVIKNLIKIGIAPLQLAFNAIKAGVVSAQLAWEQSFFGGGDPARIAELKQELRDIKDTVLDIGTGVIESAKLVVTNLVEAGTEIGSFVGDVVDGISKIDAKAIGAAASRITELKNNAKIAEAINAGLVESYDRQAEKQRQIRDDETLSIEERIAANNKLGEILEQQEVAMIANANASIAAAQADLKANNTVEAQVALIQAKNEKLGILAQIEGFRSEQKVNTNALAKEENEINQIGIDGEIAREKIRREYKTSKINDNVARIKQEQTNLEIEKKIELERLQSIVNSAKDGTAAKIKAMQDLYDAQLEFEILKDEKQIKLDEAEAARIEKEKKDEADAVQRKKDANAAKIASDKEFAERTNEFTNNIFELSNALGAQDEASVERRAKRQFAIQKALNLSMAIIDGVKAVQASIALSPVAIGAVPNPVGIKALAFVAATSAANIATIAKSKYKSSGGAGATSAPKPAIPAAPPVAAETITGSQEGNTTEVISSGGIGINQQQQPIKVTVLESDITTTQDIVASLRTRSEIG